MKLWRNRSLYERVNLLLLSIDRNNTGRNNRNDGSFIQRHDVRFERIRYVRACDRACLMHGEKREKYFERCFIEIPISDIGIVECKFSVVNTVP